MIKKLLLIIAAILLLLILVVGGVIGYAAGTEKGLMQTLSLAQKYAPGTLQWNSAKGQLFGPLNLDDLSYEQADGLSIKLASAELNWEPKQLLKKQVRINGLKASDIEIHLPPAKEKEEPDEPFSLPNIDLAVSFDVQALDLHDIKIFPHGAEEPIVIEKLNLSAAAEGAKVQLLDFKLQSPEVIASVNGTLEPTGDYPLDINLNWEYRHSEFGLFNGVGEITGDLTALHLNHQLNGAANATIKAKISDAMENLSWDADIDLNADNPQIFSPQFDSKPLTAKIHSNGKPAEFNANGSVDLSAQPAGQTRLDFHLTGDSKKLLLEKALITLADHPAELLLHGSVELETQLADFKGEWKELNWPMDSAPQYQSIHGNLIFRGTPRSYQAEIKAQLDGVQLIPITAGINAAGTDKNIELSRISVKALENDLSLNAKAQFEFEGQTFSANGNWQSLTWPMKGEAQFESPKGNFKADGKVTDYQFDLGMELSGAAIPKGKWKLKGQGSDKALSLFTLDGKTLDGNLQANGSALWNPQVSWNVELNGNGLNPGIKWPDADGKIDLKLTSSGKLTEDGPQLTANIEQLAGKLRGQPLKGQGEVAVNGKNLDLKGLRISSGDARLNLNGNLGDKWNVDWDINAKDLSKLAPDFRGSISGKGTLKGTAEQPRAKFNLQVSELAGTGIKIKKLNGEGNLDVSGKNSSRIKLRGENLQLAGQNWNELSLDGSGVPKKHSLQLALNGKLAKLKTAISGGLKDQSWAGQLTELTANKTEFGNWNLEKPANIQVNKTAASTDSLCLFSQPTKLCITGDWDAKNGSKGEIELFELKPGMFEKYLPPGLKLNTALNGRANGKINLKGDIDANANFTFKPGLIRIEGEGEPVLINLRQGGLKAKVINNKVDSNLTVDLGNTGNINATTVINDFKEKQQLSGNLKAQLKDMAIISGFAPQLQAVKGNLDADLKLGGTVKIPLFSGQLAVKDFETEVPQMATKIVAPEFSISSDGNGPLKLKALAESGAGKLTVTGQFNPKDKGLDIKVKGNDFEVANSKAIKAVISPDLSIQMNNEGMRVEGEILIPKAHINAKGAGGEAGVVTVSSDVVIVEDGEVTETKSAASKMNLDVKVVLGDDIKVEVADFSGELQGSLKIQQTPELAPSGTGMIEVVNGDYLVYGQQLQMQRGRVLFGGGPIDNPRLDMDVARRVEAYDVVAGAYIRGTAQAPQVQLYSEPAMPDASILSYMILGQPPGTKGGSYTLGKYLTPDLYVGYSIGLFNAINTFNLRYKLTEKLGLHAASGVGNSADLIYTIER